MQPLIVMAAIIRRADTVLLTRRPEGSRHGGLWEFPGGKLDPGETPTQGLARELREELDIRAHVGDIFDVAYYRYDWGPVLILAYDCRIMDGHIRNLEVAEHRWVPVTELDTLPILPADAPIISKLKKFCIYSPRVGSQLP